MPVTVSAPPGAFRGLSKWHEWHVLSPKPPVMFGDGPSLYAVNASGTPIRKRTVGIRILIRVAPGLPFGRGGQYMRRNVALCFALLFTTLTFLHALPIADAVDVKIDEWLTPSNPPYPHDPAVAPDGSIWYTGQKANVVGRFDPKTEKFKEFTLPTPNSGPHGVIADKDGNIWYTGNAAALIGKIDPKTEKITEYKMPDPKARDPHTMAFNKAGLMYFTVQAGNFVGTLDPKSGKIALYPAPTANARPYGIMVSSKDVPFFDEFNATNIGSIDPKTLKITEYPLPDKAARPRRIAIAKDDTIYYTDYARGFLGHLDPKSGKVEEFQSPGGSNSRPYAI